MAGPSIPKRDGATQVIPRAEGVSHRGARVNFITSGRRPGPGISVRADAMPTGKSKTIGISRKRSADYPSRHSASSDSRWYFHIVFGGMVRGGLGCPGVRLPESHILLSSSISIGRGGKIKAHRVGARAPWQATGGSGTPGQGPQKKRQGGRQAPQ